MTDDDAQRSADGKPDDYDAIDPEYRRAVADHVFGAFIRLIREVDREFIGEPTARPSLGDLRERYATALTAVGFFFDQMREPYALAFHELNSALRDLNRGAIHPLLQATRTDNRPPEPSGLWRVRACVVLALEALICSKRTPTSAAAEIAGRLPHLSQLAGARSKASGKTVLNWRKEFHSKRIKNKEAATYFAYGMDQIAWLKRHHPDRLAKFAYVQLGDEPNFSEQLIFCLARSSNTIICPDEATLKGRKASAENLRLQRPRISILK